MNFTPKPVHQAVLLTEFSTTEERDKFLDAVRTLLTSEQLRNVDKKTRATCCRLCGIDRKYGTLGSGIAPAWDAIDECRGAFGMGCLRRQKANAAEATR